MCAHTGTTVSGSDLRVCDSYTEAKAADYNEHAADSKCRLAQKSLERLAKQPRHEIMQLKSFM